MLREKIYKSVQQVQKRGKKTYCYLDTASDGGTLPGQLASENENTN